MRRWIRTALASSVLLVGCAGVPEPSDPEPPPPAVEPPPDMVNLVKEGQSTTIDALDSEGAWGTITVTRLEDVGGYPFDDVDPDTFIVQFRVEYEAFRQPGDVFGVDDWALARLDGLRPIGQPFLPTQPPDPAEFQLEWQTLGIGPGAVDIVSTPLAGLLAFQIPRSVAAETDVVLVHRPRAAGPITAYLARLGGDAGPEPVPTATPVPTPEAVAYVDREGAPFPLIDDPDADALFDDTDTCTNPDAGYTVSFPDAWWTNTAVGTTPACSWFSPTHFEVEGDPSIVPSGIAISITVIPGAIGFINDPQYDLHETVQIGGYSGYRHQLIGVRHPAGGLEDLPPVYTYVAVLDTGIGEGPTFLASTSSEGGANYVLNRAVLDRMIASLVFE